MNALRSQALLFLFAALFACVSATDCSSIYVAKYCSDSCAWCYLDNACYPSTNFTHYCPLCQTAATTKTRCEEIAGVANSTYTDDSAPCSWCQSRYLCQPGYIFNTIPRCDKCSDLNRYQCKVLSKGCEWCEVNQTCHDRPATTGCNCSSLGKTSCEASVGCSWCPSSAGDNQTSCFESTYFLGDCTPCSSYNGTVLSKCPGECVNNSATGLCEDPAVNKTDSCTAATTSTACTAISGCLWDSSFGVCLRKTQLSCGSNTLQGSCVGTPGCRWCDVGSCVTLDSYSDTDSTCTCGARTSSTCETGSDLCKRCNGTTTCASRKCEALADINKTECVASGNKWCQTILSCLTAEEANQSLVFCECTAFKPPAICWHWTGCEICSSDSCAETGLCGQTTDDTGTSSKTWLWIVIGCCAGFVVLVFIGVIVAASLIMRRPSNEETTLQLRKFDVSRSKEYAAGDPSFGLTVSKQHLDFGARTSPLEVDKSAVDEVTITNTSMDRMSWFVALPDEPERFEMTISDSQGTLDPQEEISLQISILPHCTTNLDFGIPLVNEGVGHTLLRVKARTALTIKLDYNELQVHSLIGEGNYGRVYKGTWRGTEVAIKEYRAGMLEIEHIKNDVLREIDLLSRLRSPHVVTFYGVVLTRAHCCIVMEFCSLGSLGSLMTKMQFSPQLAIKFVLGCARGMQFLHANHVLHRDLKTDNLLVVSVDVASPSHVKLTDFGASRLVSDEGAATYTKGVGTCTYMAPEILNNMPYAAKADVYSFSLVLWSVLTQQAPFFDFPNQFTIIKFVVEGQRPPPPKGAPPTAVELMRRCWDPEPDRRPSFDQIVGELENIDASLMSASTFA